ncbi:MAG: nucleotidyltransferase family protein [Anaerolineae bacterium]|nr:nucleotidyltransferase family protein [Anaerolineae bacterium]
MNNLQQTEQSSLALFTNILQASLPDLRQRYGLSAVWLFGSVVRGEASPDSDLDVLVTFDNQHLSLLEFIQLEQELSDLLQVKVDLIERDTLKPTIGQEILREAIAV